jgi:PPOX class probable F420-dependent enzyme
MALTRSEAEEFLAGVHVAVLAVDDPGRGPLATPVWYRYSPGGMVELTVASSSRKRALLEQAGRAALCVQIESWPYRYVSVEGPVEIVDPRPDDTVELMAVRYLGPEQGRRYAEGTTWPGVLVRLTPQRWRSADFSSDPQEEAATGRR